MNPKRTIGIYTETVTEVFIPILWSSFQNNLSLRVKKFQIMLSKKTRYAMLALMRLAREYESGVVPISRIAASEQIPQRFLEGILLSLKKMGIVDSSRGKNGGYFLTKSPAEITLVSIVNKFEGGVGMLRCVSNNNYEPCEFCKDEDLCKLRRTFQQVHDSTYVILENTTFRDIT